MNHRSFRNQRGGSLLGNVLLLALFAYGIYIGIQYVPQYIESKSLDSVLQSIRDQHGSHPYVSAQQVSQAISSNLNLNQMDDMMKHVQVREGSPGISIEVSYQRELDLVFRKMTLSYDKSVDLD